MLVKDSSPTTPVTRSVVFSIVLDMFALSGTIVMALLTALIKRMADNIARTIEIMAEMDQMIWKLAKVPLGSDPSRTGIEIKE
jgi:hypothetical protein